MRSVLLATTLLLLGAPTAREALAGRARPAPSLEKDLEPVLRTSALRDVAIGVHVLDSVTGEELFARNADDPLTPASTMKLVTAAAALDALGPSHRFRTRVKVDGEIADGVLAGNLYVRGEADPTIVIEKLWKLVYDIKLEGIDQIRGNVVFDASFLDLDFTLPGWDKPIDLEEGPTYFPPIGALSLNFNTVAVVIGPGEAEGRPARAVLETPAGDWLRLENSAVTAAGDGRRRIEVDRRTTNDTMTIEVRGTVPLGTDADRYYRTVSDPLAYFMGAFDEMTRIVGVDVKGELVAGATPSTARTLFELSSPPLATILADTNKYSNNFMAEMVLRSLGATRGAGTNENGLRVVADYLSSLGIAPGEYVLVNGSGLSRDARLRPSHIAAVLLDMASDQMVGAEFVSSLSIAGRDGTLRRRLVDDPGAVRGKTGTLNGVHCLAGYAVTADERRVAFVFLTNEVRGSVARVKDVQDEFLQALVDADLAQAAR